MDQQAKYSYFVQSADQIPLHLKDRAPFALSNTEAIFRWPEKEVVGPDARVLMAGAIELQTQITPGMLTDLCDPEELYKPEMRDTYRFRSVYDPEIQRGVKETSSGLREFLRPSQIESMMQDIYDNKFECPQLMWNLRAGETIWVYVRDARELRVYEGVATRPDTNHRHHAIVRVHRKYQQWMRDTGSTQMGPYNPYRAYGLVVYTDDFKGEAHRFYVYNFLGWRVPTSTAHYIESKTAAPNLYSRMARELMERCQVLGAPNVELLSNHLSRNSAKMVTFGTLVDALKAGFPKLTEQKYDEIVNFMLDVLAGLSTVRPNEIAVLSVAQRQRVRESSVADQTVMWHAYFRLAGRLWEDANIRLAGRLSEDRGNWGQALLKLREEYTTDGYKGDLFSRANPAWAKCGVIAPGKKGPRVVNNRESRQGAFEFLCEITGVPRRPDLDALLGEILGGDDDKE